MVEIESLLNSLKQRRPQIMNQEAYRRYGILIPLVHVDSETHVLFEVRSMKLRSQPGDICFPGGRLDNEDASLKACAIRETEEEIGIHANQINHVISLDYIVSETRIIHPFAGELNSLADIDINQSEVSEVFTVPLRFFLDNAPRVHKIYFNVEPEQNFPFDLIQNGKAYDWKTREMNELFYEYDNRVIWGLTARVMHHFIQIINQYSKGQR